MDDLIAELDYLRVEGLSLFDPERLRHLGQLVVEAGWAVDLEHVAVAAIRDLVRQAVRTLDDGAFVSSAACLYGLNKGALDNTLIQRTKAARVALGLGSTRAYTGNPEKSRQRDDVRKVAYGLEAVTLEAAQRRAEQQAANALLVNPALWNGTTEPPDAISQHLEGRSAQDWQLDRTQAWKELWEKLLAERDRQTKEEPPSKKVCVFVSGSFGREEAMEFSDLDVFLVDDVRGKPKSARHGKLTTFEQAAVLTLLDRCRRAREIQQFSKSGYYQEIQSFHRMLIESGGKKEGPASLTTARALLLANSKCFWNDQLYKEMREKAMDDYWRDGNDDLPLRPTYLINDLRKVWLTMLVDFERFYGKINIVGERYSTAERKMASLKLSVIQRLGIYTPILSLLERSNSSGLLRSDAETVLEMTTWQRLEELSESTNAVIAKSAAALNELYGQYLGFSWCRKEDMAKRVADDWPVIKRHFRQTHQLILQMLWEYNRSIPEVARHALV